MYIFKHTHHGHSLRRFTWWTSFTRLPLSNSAQSDECILSIEHSFETNDLWLSLSYSFTPICNLCSIQRVSRQMVVHAQASITSYWRIYLLHPLFDKILNKSKEWTQIGIWLCFRKMRIITWYTCLVVSQIQFESTITTFFAQASSYLFQKLRTNFCYKSINHYFLKTSSQLTHLYAKYIT
jgi:hypothetical protein